MKTNLLAELNKISATGIEDDKTYLCAFCEKEFTIEEVDKCKAHIKKHLKDMIDDYDSSLWEEHLLVQRKQKGNKK